MDLIDPDDYLGLSEDQRTRINLWYGKRLKPEKAEIDLLEKCLDDPQYNFMTEYQNIMPMKTLKDMVQQFIDENKENPSMMALISSDERFAKAECALIQVIRTIKSGMQSTKIDMETGVKLEPKMAVTLDDNIEVLVTINGVSVPQNNRLHSFFKNDHSPENWDINKEVTIKQGWTTPDIACE